jgi:hypothetical protein
MFYIKLLLLLSVGTGFDALSNKQRLDILESKLENVLNKSEICIMELEEKLQKVDTCNLHLCNEPNVNVTNEMAISTYDLKVQMDNINKTIKDEIDKVFAYIEKNSHALMDEFQNTLTVLMNQHRNMNQKIRFNSNSVRKLEGKHRKTPSIINDQMKMFEHKISVLDNDLENMIKSITKQSESIDNIGQHLLKLDRKDDDFLEKIDRNYRIVSGLDHNLVEIERRFRELALDLGTFKDDTKKEIKEIKMELHLDQISTEAITITKTCPQQWVQHQTKCYKYVDVAVDWKTALMMCQDFNAKLAEPVTKEEMDYIRRSFQGWIGAIAVNGTFLWESSEQIVEQLSSEIPDILPSSQKCAYILKTMIRVERCAIRLHYICEKETI